MATRAFILIETSAGKSQDVAEAVQKLDGVKSADMVTGPYDLIAVTEMAHLKAVADLVGTKIHPIAGINRTVTCLTIWPT